MINETYLINETNIEAKFIPPFRPHFSYPKLLPSSPLIFIHSSLVYHFPSGRYSFYSFEIKILVFSSYSLLSTLLKKDRSYISFKVSHIHAHTRVFFPSLSFVNFLYSSSLFTTSHFHIDVLYCSSTFAAQYQCYPITKSSDKVQVAKLIYFRVFFYGTYLSHHCSCRVSFLVMKVNRWIVSFEVKLDEYEIIFINTWK